MTATTLPPADRATAPRPRRVRDARRPLLFLLVGSPLMIVAYQTRWLHPVLWLAILLVASHLLLRREGLSLAALGLRRSWRAVGEFVGGFGGGAMLVVVAALLIRATLPFPWARNPSFDPMYAAGAMYYLFLVNSAEELVFRGYSFVGLVRAYGHWPAQILTALVFAMFHLASGWPWEVALVATTTGSVLYALVFLRWRSVPAAVGVHLATNWVRDLFLLDPPTRATLLAPLSPRPWTADERLLTNVIFSGCVVVASVLLWRSIRRRAASDRAARPGVVDELAPS